MTENTGQEKQPDSTDDPAHDAGEPDDWSSEGGAVSEGPATHPADGTPEDESDS